MKNKSKILSLIFLLLVAISCGKKEGNSVADKKAKISELQKLVASSNNEIQKLQAEVEKLEPTKTEKVKTVSVTPVVLSNFKHYVESTGRIEAENNVYVSAQGGGAITNMYVKLGDFVAKGQKIAAIDNSVLKNTIQEVQIQLETARNIYERQKNLWDQKIGTEVQLIQAKTQVESLERKISTLKSQENLNIVRAPISGMVDEVRLKAGEMASPGMGIVRIVNASSLKVVGNISDTYAGTISKGDLVTIKFPDLGREIQAPLTFVGQTINPASRTFLVEARIPSGKDFKPNLMVVLNINDQSQNGAIVIPENTVQNTEQGQIVYVAAIEGNKKVAKARKVTTGNSYDGKIEIKTGISAGDEIITEGYQEIVDGQLINY